MHLPVSSPQSVADGTQASTLSIEAIAKLIREHQPSPAQWAAIQKTANAEPAVELAGDELADFYFRRALAARALMRSEQEEHDFRRAYSVEGVVSSRRRFRALSELSRTLSNNQQPEKVLELLGAVPPELRAPWIHVARGSALWNLSRRTEAIREYSLTEQTYLELRQRLAHAPDASEEELHFWNVLMHTNVLTSKIILARRKDERGPDIERLLRRRIENAELMTTILPSLSFESVPPSADGIWRLLAEFKLELAAHLLNSGRAREAEQHAREALVAQVSFPKGRALSQYQAGAILARILLAQGRFAQAGTIRTSGNDSHKRERLLPQFSKVRPRR